jgi:hypothetical protein
MYRVINHNPLTDGAVSGEEDATYFCVVVAPVVVVDVDADASEFQVSER